MARLLDVALDGLADAVVILAASGECIKANDAACAWFGPAVARNIPLKAQPATFGIHRETGELYDPADLPMQRALRGEDVDRELVVIRRPRLKDRYVTASARSLEGSGCRIGGAVGVFHDVTEERRAEKALRASERDYRLLAQHLPGMSVAMFDKDLRYIVAEGEGLRIAGYRREQLEGELLFDVVPRATYDVFAPILRRSLEMDEPHTIDEYRTTNGHTFSVQVLPIRDNGHSRLMVVSRDVTEERTRAKDLERIALFDKLTGLPNRRSAEDALEREIARARRHLRSMSVAVVDIDHFKRVNDTLGHAAGDDVLRSVSSVLRESVRAEDFVGRWGGEEFIVLLPDTDALLARSSALRMRRAVEERTDVTVSIGVAGLRGGEEAGAMLERADARLYEAKAAGRNRIA